MRQVISETTQCKIAQLKTFIMQRHNTKTINFTFFQNFLFFFGLLDLCQCSLMQFWERNGNRSKRKGHAYVHKSSYFCMPYRKENTELMNQNTYTEVDLERHICNFPYAGSIVKLCLLISILHFSESRKV